MAISSLDNIVKNMPEQHSMDAEQANIYMEVIAESLKVNHKNHLFNWFQGTFQSLLPHDILIYGIKPAGSDFFHFDYYTATRYFSEQHFSMVTKFGEGLVQGVLSEWGYAKRIILDGGICTGLPANCLIMNTDPQVLSALELVNYAAYGFEDKQSGISTFFFFSRLRKGFDNKTAQMLEMLMSHLHLVMVRVSSAAAVTQSPSQRAAKHITTREVEILQWVYAGKTNWEIATILEISPLTVKNHVQNILRKLDVQNRRQAAIRASKLGLVKS